MHDYVALGVTLYNMANMGPHRYKKCYFSWITRFQFWGNVVPRVFLLGNGINVHICHIYIILEHESYDTNSTIVIVYVCRPHIEANDLVCVLRTLYKAMSVLCDLICGLLLCVIVWPQLLLHLVSSVILYFIPVILSSLEYIYLITYIMWTAILKRIVINPH